jgi:hypothetical protein
LARPGWRRSRLANLRIASFVDLLDLVDYLIVNRTRPASVFKDMHTGRVFCFQSLISEFAWR